MNTINLPTLNAALPFTELQVIEEFNKHTLFRAKVDLSDVTQNPDIAGAPFSVTLQGRTWVGYVNGTKARDQRWVTLIGVGATFVLKNGALRTWKDATLSRIVKDVCAPHHITTNVTLDQTFKTIAQSSGQSDWQFLNDIAFRAGLYVASEGTSVTLFDPIAQYQTPSLATALTKRSDVRAGQLISFDAYSAQQVGDRLDSSGAIYGNGVGAKGVHAAFSAPIQKVVTSAADAKAEVQARLRRSFLVHTATMKCLGNPLFSVGQAALISGTNDDGKWMMTKVTHHVDGADYKVEATLQRPASVTRTRLTTAPARPRRTPTLVGGKWKG